MKVTRDVVYDLLPAYFAGEASPDTRALIEEFFATDPEFGKMAERFRSLINRPGAVQADAAREREAFSRARTRAKLHQAAIAWTLGALMSFGLALVTGLNRGLGFRNPGVIIGIVFGGMAIASWIASSSSNPRPWHADLVGDGEHRG